MPEQFYPVQDFLYRVLTLEILSTLAHDLNNPLMIISGNAQLIQMQHNLAESLQKRVVIIQEECLKSRHILQDQIVRLRQPPPDCENFDINQGLSILLESNQSLFSQARITIHKKFPPHPLTVKINSEMFKAMLAPVLHNAIEAMPQGGAITVQLAVDAANYVQISITDDGEGIPSEKLKQMTRPFFTTKPGKLGLGLTLSQGIAKNLGGVLFMEQTLPKGIKITITLPLATIPA